MLEVAAKPTIYIITHYKFNHGPLRQEWEQYRLDKRFTEGKGNYVFYLIDKEVPGELENQATILESKLDPVIHDVGNDFLKEWSFLLMEAKHGFADYPLYMISSRFYEKNHWLRADLNSEWDMLFSYLKQYGWGYLPSYDRPMRWINMDWTRELEKEVWNHRHFPYRKKTFELIHDLFGIHIPNDYQFSADLWCNYIGFRSRNDLLAYVKFYQPLLDYFFDDEYKLKRSMEPYICGSGFRAEKPLTFLFELVSHLFFFVNRHPYCALHYDGYYSIDEFHKKMEKIEDFSLPLKLRLERKIKWAKHRLFTETRLASLRNKAKEWLITRN